jgi:hypothetical protein
MSVITDPKHPYSAPKDGVCSFCANKLEPPYVSWLVMEEWIDENRQAPGTVIDGHLFVCSRCLWIRSGLLEDLEHLAELNGRPASTKRSTRCAAGKLPVADGGRDC